MPSLSQFAFLTPCPNFGLWLGARLSFRCCCGGFGSFVDTRSVVFFATALPRIVQSLNKSSQVLSVENVLSLCLCCC